MEISVFGLGYVGTVCAACFVAEKHHVIGVDVNQAKVDALSSGVAPIVEPKLPELIAEGQKAGFLRATTSAALT